MRATTHRWSLDTRRPCRTNSTAHALSPCQFSYLDTKRAVKEDALWHRQLRWHPVCRSACSSQTRNKLRTRRTVAPTAPVGPYIWSVTAWIFKRGEPVEAYCSSDGATKALWSLSFHQFQYPDRKFLHEAYSRSNSAADTLPLSQL